MHNWQVVFTLKAYLLYLFSFILMIAVETTISRLYLTSRNPNMTQVDYILHSIGYAPKIPEVRIRPLANLIFVPAIILFTGYYVVGRFRYGMSLGGEGLSALGTAKELGEYNGFSRGFFNFVRFVSLFYGMTLVQNLVRGKPKIRGSVSAWIVVICAILCHFISGSRATLICYVIALVVMAFVSMYDVNTGKGVHANRKFLWTIALLACAAFAFLLLSRSVVKGRNISTPIVHYTTYYFGSGQSLMGKIVEEPDLAHEPFVGYFGERTFWGLYNTLYNRGILPSPPADRQWIRLGGNVTSAGNEYTFFVGPYVDFGFLGTLIFIVTIYAFFSFIYYKKILNRKISQRRCVMLVFYSYLYTIVALSFYMDSFRSFSRPVNILYYIFIVVFAKLFVKIRYSKEILVQAV